MRKLLVLPLLISSALADISMDNRRVISVSVSQEGLSRISVDGQRIENVFAHPTSVNSSLHLHESGHLFISPAGLEGPVFLSVLTESGLTQDLKLSFISKAPAPIILKPKEETVKKDPQEIYRSYLKVFMRGGAPQGFTPYRAKTKSCQAWAVNGMEMQLKRSYWSGQYRLLEFTGEACEDGPIYPEAFTRTGDVAVVLNRRQVSSGDVVNVYILSKGGWRK